jgi:hypothetical protein
MPHERGSSPVLPSEFFCIALADPKARFCRSLASYSTRQRYSACHLSKPLTLRHLNYIADLAAEGLALPPPADACVPIHNHITRQPNQPHSLK